MKLIDSHSQLIDPASSEPFAPRARGRRVLKRVCEIGFLLFLLKGVAWLVVGWLSLRGLR